ncbi:MAG: hemerythrin domain-containing protein [Mycobacteriales bacterium]
MIRRRAGRCVPNLFPDDLHRWSRRRGGGPGVHDIAGSPRQPLPDACLGGVASRARPVDDEAEHAKHENAEVQEIMKRLEKLQPDDPTFDDELAALMQGVREHVAKEEGQMFPHMREVFSQEELVELGARVEAVKKIAPTRPHPSAPDEPPGDKLLGPVAGLLDRMRDAVSKRGTQR